MINIRVYILNLKYLKVFMEIDDKYIIFTMHQINKNMIIKLIFYFYKNFYLYSIFGEK